jgi:riboflavin biosynthesis pyrimidine reductase
VEAGQPVRISWELNLERRYPRGAASPDPARLEPLGFPPPWPDRPWIYANFISSSNGIVAWRRRGLYDDPIRAIAGGDFKRPGRRADVQFMRYLRAVSDAVSVGAQTLRDQPELVATLSESGSDLGAVLERFRVAQGLLPLPRQIVYTLSGALDLGARMFDAPGGGMIVVTTEHGARRLLALGSERKGVTLLVAGEADLGSRELVHAHQRLFADFGVKYLDCEGGATILDALREAGLLDEIFITTTEVVIDPSEHEEVKRLGPPSAARLLGEGRTALDAGYVFRRWRLNER